MAPLSTPFVKGEGQTLVVQYEVKLAARGHNCAGAYLKLVAADGMPAPSALAERTPYVVMFGPDKCGLNNKVHFILRHQNPKSEVWSEHHLKEAPPAKTDNQTHLYTLIVRPDNTFDLQIDMVSVKVRARAWGVWLGDHTQTLAHKHAHTQF
jgi:calnexin